MERRARRVKTRARCFVSCARRSEGDTPDIFVHRGANWHDLARSVTQECRSKTPRILLYQVDVFGAHTKQKSQHTRVLREPAVAVRGVERSRDARVSWRRRDSA